MFAQNNSTTMTRPTDAPRWHRPTDGVSVRTSDRAFAATRTAPVRTSAVIKHIADARVESQNPEQYRANLLAKAQRYSTSRMSEALNGHSFYDITEHDAVSETAKIQKVGSAANDTYTVNLRTLKCDCADYCFTLYRLNEELDRAGLCGNQRCKHGLMVMVKRPDLCGLGED